VRQLAAAFNIAFSTLSFGVAFETPAEPKPQNAKSQALKLGSWQLKKIFAGKEDFTDWIQRSKRPVISSL
jgi:hypothetical protein